MNDQDPKDLEVSEAPEGELDTESSAAVEKTEAAADETPADAAPEAAPAATADDDGSQKATDAPADGEEAPADGEEAPTEPPPDYFNEKLKWFVVHTYSGYENRAKLALEERIKREGQEEHFGLVLIPTEEVVEMSRGKRRTSKRKFFPGYMLVQMNLTESSWYLVKSTPKITGFVGNSTSPLPVPDAEIRRITSQIADGTDRLKPKIIFEKGDSVRVVDGPFANFNGSIDDVDMEKGKLRVLVSIFGRATPVEMDFVQVEKT